MKKKTFKGYSKTFNRWIIGFPYFSDGRCYMLVDDNNKNENIGTGSYDVDENTIEEIIS